MKTMSRRQILKTGAVGGAGAVLASMGFAALPVNADDGNPSKEHGGEHADRKVEANLKLFDTLDFEAWNKKNWELFRKLHTDDVVVYYFDGSKTVGIDAHVAASQASLQNGDLIITAHPIRFGQGDYTAVTGTFEVRLPNGTVVAKSEFVTIALWRKGRIAEERLYGWSTPAPK